VEENQVPNATATSDITDDDKLWALLGWIIPIIALIVLFLEDKKNRPFIKYNAVLSLAVAVVVWVPSGILSTIFVGCFIGLAGFIYEIYLGIQAYQGNWVTVPWLSDFVKKQGWV
jgi:uncharacterized membrane protein